MSPQGLKLAAGAGLTLVELMVSMALGLIVVLAATSLLLSVQRSYSTQDDLLRLDENGRFALEVLSRTIRQAGFEPPRAGHEPELREARVLGLDASSLPRNSIGISDARPSLANGSDVLAIRHPARGSASITNCAGFKPGTEGEARDTWSIFYLGRDAAGEPQLYCKYEGEQGWSADAIASGIESFQVLYGIDSNEDGIPDRILSASDIGAAGMEVAAPMWNRVVMVRVAMLLRGPGRQSPSARAVTYDLFGPVYGEQHASTDAGVRLGETELVAQEGAHMRKVVESTIYLRNPPEGEAR